MMAALPGGATSPVPVLGRGRGETVGEHSSVIDIVIVLVLVVVAGHCRTTAEDDHEDEDDYDGFTPGQCSPVGTGHAANPFLGWCDVYSLYLRGLPVGVMGRRRVARPRPAAAGSGGAVRLHYRHCPERGGEHRAEVADLLAMDYPADRFEVLVASDASTDATHAIVAACEDPRVRLTAYLERVGKVEAINRTVPLARGEFLVFMDARQRVDPGQCGR